MEHREMKSGLSRKPLPCWLALTVLEGAMQVAEWGGVTIKSSNHEPYEMQ